MDLSRFFMTLGLATSRRGLRGFSHTQPLPQPTEPERILHHVDERLQLFVLAWDEYATGQRGIYMVKEVHGIEFSASTQKQLPSFTSLLTNKEQPAEQSNVC